MKVTPEVIEALRTLRKIAWGGDVEDAINTLDNAGVFAEIDEASGYDVDPAPEQVSKCTCPAFVNRDMPIGVHMANCPGDPAEWGDSAFSDLTDEQLRGIAFP